MSATALGRTETVSEAFDGYALPGRYLHAPGGGAPVRLLALHGARSDLRRLDPWLLPLRARGVGSLACSLSGHGGGSPIGLADTSLARNLGEALRFAARLPSGPAVLMGHSLGGALAMKVAEAHEATVHTLVLGGPALYPEAAYAAPRFGPPFTEAISVPFGFLDSGSLAFLRRFRGRVLLVVGEHDGLPAAWHGGRAGRSAGTVALALPDGRTRQVYSPIPAEAIEAIEDAAGPRCQKIVLEGCDHLVSAHLRAHPAVAGRLADLVCEAVAAGGAPAGRGLRVAVTGCLRQAALRG